MIITRVKKNSLNRKWNTLLVFGKEDIDEIDNLVKYLWRSVDILIISKNIDDKVVLDKLNSLVDEGNIYWFEDMKKELILFEYSDVNSWKLKTMLIVPPKVVKKKSLFIGYNVETLVIPKNLKELDKDNIIERHLFPIMAARKGSEIIYL